MMPSKNIKCLTLENLNPCIRDMEYAVRGPLFNRAIELEEELKKGISKPFKDIIYVNIGCCHSMGQIPITFIRQILAAVSYPQLIDEYNFPEDVKNKARMFLNASPGNSMGSYTHSAGGKLVRQLAAEFIEKRDGIPADWENIFFANGASIAIASILKLLKNEKNGKKSGVMLPIPEYPLYSALLTEFNMQKISYYLDEEDEWALNIDELQNVYNEAKKTCTPRAIVVVNPGNPTSQVLSRDNIERIIKFAHANNLFILADEVYQQNIYQKDKKFHSFKKVMIELGEPYCKMELASFMSCSKGYMGECGIRGGYVELINMYPEIKEMYNKSIILNLCPNTYGQACLFCIFNEPKVGDPSYKLFEKEKKSVLETLKIRAKLVVDALNELEGYKCNPVQGSLYVFAQITLPPKAIKTANELNMEPDAFYAWELLEKAGISLVPGCGFGQKPGTFHFRTTILAPTEKLNIMVERLRKFHDLFLKRYT